MLKIKEGVHSHRYLFDRTVVCHARFISNEWTLMSHLHPGRNYYIVHTACEIADLLANYITASYYCIIHFPVALNLPQAVARATFPIVVFLHFFK